MKIFITFIVFILLALNALSFELPFEILFDNIFGKWQTTNWGETINGLRMRVSLHKEFDYSDTLYALIEIQKDFSELNEDISYLQNSRGGIYINYHFIEKERGALISRFRGNPFEYYNNIDTSKQHWSLLKNNIDSILIKLPLRQIRPGYYDGYAVLVVSGKDTSGWTGVLTSGQFSFYVHEKITNKDTFLVTIPKALKFDKGPQLVYDGSEVIAIEYDKGLTLGTYIRSGTGGLKITNRIMSEDLLRGPNYSLLLGKDADTIYLDYKIELFQSNNPPGHMWSPGGRDYKILWSNDYSIEITRDSLAKLRIPAIESNIIHTVFMPGQLRVENRQEIYAAWIEPIEISLKKGKYLYTVIFVDKEKRILLKGFPQGKLLEFKDKVSRDTTNIITLSLLQSELPDLTLKRLIKEGRYDFITYREYELSCEYDHFELVDDDNRYGTRIKDSLRLFIMPGSLKLDKGLKVKPDFTDSIFVKFSKPESTFIYFMVHLEGSQPEIVSTYMPDLIGIWTPYDRICPRQSRFIDTTISCNIKIIQSYPRSEHPSHIHDRYDVIWENDYEFTVSRKQRKKLEGKAGFLGIF